MKLIKKILNRSNVFANVFSLAFLCVLFSCGGSVKVDVPGAALKSIAVTPAHPSIANITAQQFTATGSYSNGSTQNLTTTVTWSSSNTGVATISNSAGSQGLGTAVSAGTTTISAAFSGKTSYVPLTVTAATVSSIAVTPVNPSIADGTSQQFTATGTFSDSSIQNLTATVTWSSSNTGVATISNAAGTRGRATTVSAGTTTISAVFGGKTGKTTLTVTAATLSSIAVTPVNPSIANGTTRQFTATGTFSDSSTQDLTTAATWSSSNAGVATISNAGGSQGLATSVSAGTTTIRATMGSVFGTTKLTITSLPVSSGAPLILYTDIVSGPTSGGENNNGIYLSIFGKNFGNDINAITVTIGTAGVASKMFFGISKGRPDIQQITVQVGSLGSAAMGTPLSIKVTVNGTDSNTDNTFTPNPGKIYFVNNVSGVDTSDISTGGTITAPFKSVQRSAGATLTFSIDPADVSGVWGRVRAGDFIVMRGTGVAYTTNAITGENNGFLDYFLQALNKSGCAIGTLCPQGGGTTSGPITIMGYPAEDVFINDPYASASGAISSADSQRILNGYGHWINVVDLRIESGNHDGAVNTQAGGTNWRIVNNELTCATAINNDTAKAGGIAGDGHVTVAALGPSVGSFYYGNYIHDVYNGPDDGNSNFENHGIYIDGAGNYDIGYNRIENIRGGNGISLYANGTLGNNNIDGVSFHHNSIKNVGKHGINVTDGTRNNIKIWNNIVIDTDFYGLRFNSTELVSAKFYNNTFYNCLIKAGQSGSGYNAVVANSAGNLTPSKVDIRNNIIWAHDTSVLYFGGSFDDAVAYNNLFYNGSGSAFGFSTVTGNPLFVADGTNFSLQASSPAIDHGTATNVSAIVTNDYDITTSRPQGSEYDIGAYEYVP